MTEVKISAADSWKGCRKQDGAAAWRVECERRGKVEAREGRILLRDGTQEQAELMALSEALGILLRPCRIRIYTECAAISTAVSNGWPALWQGNGWKNARGKAVKNAAEWNIFLESAKRHDYIVEYRTPEKGLKERAQEELEQWKKNRKAQEGTQMTLEGWAE